MELREQGSLAQRVRDGGPLPVAEALRIGVKIAGALESAAPGGRAPSRREAGERAARRLRRARALADFGIATVADRTASTTTKSSYTLDHAPPEVLNGAAPAAASDVYALGRRSTSAWPGVHRSRAISLRRRRHPRVARGAGAARARRRARVAAGRPRAVPREGPGGATGLGRGGRRGAATSGTRARPRGHAAPGVAGPARGGEHRYRCGGRGRRRGRRRDVGGDRPPWRRECAVARPRSTPRSTPARGRHPDCAERAASGRGGAELFDRPTDGAATVMGGRGATMPAELAAEEPPSKSWGASSSSPRSSRSSC